LAACQRGHDGKSPLHLGIPSQIDGAYEAVAFLFTRFGWGKADELLMNRRIRGRNQPIKKDFNSADQLGGF
jgi:hypothetical protein